MDLHRSPMPSRDEVHVIVEYCLPGGGAVQLDDRQTIGFVHRVERIGDRFRQANDAFQILSWSLEQILPMRFWDQQGVPLGGGK